MHLSLTDTIFGLFIILAWMISHALQPAKGEKEPELKEHADGVSSAAEELLDRRFDNLDTELENLRKSLERQIAALPSREQLAEAADRLKGLERALEEHKKETRGRLNARESYGGSKTAFASYGQAR